MYPEPDSRVDDAYTIETGMDGVAYATCGVEISLIESGMGA